MYYLKDSVVRSLLLRKGFRFEERAKLRKEKPTKRSIGTSIQTLLYIIGNHYQTHFTLRDLTDIPKGYTYT